MLNIVLCLFAAELFGALKGRLSDSNKNLVMAALTSIGNVASAMGPAVEKSSKVIPYSIADLIKCIFPLKLNVSGLISSRAF